MNQANEQTSKSKREQMSERGVSIVLACYNRLEFLKLTIDSIRAEITSLGNVPTEIIVIDGSSTDGTLEWLVQQKDVITIVQHNRGEWLGKQIERRSWGYFMNLGFKAAQGKYICMLSDDCLIVPGALQNGYQLFEQKLQAGEKIGAAAFYWRNWPEQEKYWVGLTLGEKMFVNHGMYLRSALQEVNFVDEDTYQFYHADGDLCLKLWQAGYQIIDVPTAFIEHYSHANTEVRASNLEKQQQDWKTYQARWSGIFENKDERKDWIELEYKDANETWKRFEAATQQPSVWEKLKTKFLNQ
jgi:GT2 family glycosyltransferase